MNDFIDQLLSLITGKVRITLKKVTDERLLYSHLIDEAIAFETDLHGIILISFHCKIKERYFFANI